MVMSLIESLTRIKNAVYGREVREAIHDGVFRANKTADETKGIAQQTEQRQGTLERYTDQMLLEMTGKDVISAPEIIQARGGKPTLDARLTVFDDDLNQRGVSVKTLGAKGDGVTDDTQVIQNALNNHSSVYVPDGIYMIDADVSLKPRSNTSLYLSDGAVLKAMTTSSEYYELIDIIEKENIRIIGGTLQGDRATHAGTSGEWGHGINMRGAKNITVEKLVSKDFWGDGIYLGASVPDRKPCENIILRDVHCDNNRRQGMSVIHIDGLYVYDSKFTRTNGTLPEAGIDFEPNNPYELINNIYFNNVETSDNAGSGMLWHLSQLTNDNHKINAVFDNFKSYRDRIGVNFDKFNGTAQGTVVFNNLHIQESLLRGFSARAFSSRFSRIVLNHPTIEDSNQSNSPSVPEGSPISIFRTSADYPEITTFKMGNIKIVDPTIIFNDGVNELGYDVTFWTLNNPAQSFELIDLIDCKTRLIFNVQLFRKSTVDTSRIDYVYNYWAGVSPVEMVSPENNRINPLIQLVDNKQCTVRLRKLDNGEYPYEFEVEHMGNNGQHAMYIKPPADEYLYPRAYSAGLGKGLYVPANVNGQGSTVTIGRRDGKWLVKNITGAWRAEA